MQAEKKFLQKYMNLAADAPDVHALTFVVFSLHSALAVFPAIVFLYMYYVHGSIESYRLIVALNVILYFVIGYINKNVKLSEKLLSGNERLVNWNLIPRVFFKFLFIFVSVLGAFSFAELKVLILQVLVCDISLTINMLGNRGW